MYVKYLYDSLYLVTFCFDLFSRKIVQDVSFDKFKDFFIVLCYVPKTLIPIHHRWLFRSIRERIFTIVSPDEKNSHYTRKIDVYTTTHRKIDLLSRRNFHRVLFGKIVAHDCDFGIRGNSSEGHNENRNC